VVLSIVGCALMVGAFGAAGPTVSGEGLSWGLTSAVFFAGYALMGRYAAPRFSPWTLLVYGLGAASIFWMIVLGGPGPIVDVLADWRAFGSVIVLSIISTVIPFAAFLKALHLIEATKASVTSTAEPVIAGLAAWVLFAERLSLSQLLGGVLVVCAVALSQVRTGTASEIPLADGAVLGDGESGA
jgi:drug/metabolite transporter (DMT)-like permease